MLYLKLRLFNVYITYYARMNLKKKINLIHFFEKFLKVEKKENLTMRVNGFLSSSSLTWVSSVQACDAAVGGEAIFRCHMANFWGFTCNNHFLLIHNGIFIGSLLCTCRLRAFTFQPPFKDRFVFRIDFRVKLEHQIVKDISRVMEICTQWFKYRFSCTGFIKKNRPHDK